MAERDNSFGREYRLRERIVLESLFAEGRGLFAFPFRVVFMASERISSGPQVVISVSKRNFKRAVDRNLLKRRIREAYRLNRHLWEEAAGFADALAGKQLAMGLIYTPKEILDYQKIFDGVKKAIISVRKDIEKRGGSAARHTD